jgi:hypothetical protein
MQRDRLGGMGSGFGCINSQQCLVWFGYGGATNKRARYPW